MVARALWPRILRSVETCTCRLFSSTYEPRPHGGEELVFRDERARAVDERDQQIERARTQRDRPTVGEQDALAGTQLEPAEAAACKRLGQGGGVTHVRLASIAAESLAPARSLWMGCLAGLRTFQALHRETKESPRAAQGLMALDATRNQ